jgi:hypothetical protein
MNDEKIYVFANGAEFISVNGECYRLVSNERGKNNVDMADVQIHASAEDCKEANE